MTISGKSSSSGSYSIGGSNPNVTEDTNDKITIEKQKELPEKVDNKKEVKKEDKVTSPMHEKEQRVPKMMVTCFLNSSLHKNIIRKFHSYCCVFFRVLSQMTNEVCIIHLQVTMKVR